MNGSRAISAIAGTRFADVRWVAETGSTNQDLLREARAGAAEGVVLVADHQTAGRGRLGRRWEAPPGSSLLVSVLTRPALALERANDVVMAVAVAAAEACREAGGVTPGLKWPNDLVMEVDGETRKVGGILAESIVEGGRLEALVVGLGLNVRWPDPLPEELAAVATSLNLHTDRPVEREELLVALLRHLDRTYEALDDAEAWAAVRRRYRELSATLGRRVRVELSDGSFEGDAVDVDERGSLLVSVPGEGQPRVVLAGDVVHLRAAGAP